MTTVERAKTVLIIIRCRQGTWREYVGGEQNYQEHNAAREQSGNLVYVNMDSRDPGSST